VFLPRAPASRRPKCHRSVQPTTSALRLPHRTGSSNTHPQQHAPTASTPAHAYHQKITTGIVAMAAAVINAAPSEPESEPEGAAKYAEGVGWVLVLGWLLLGVALIAAAFCMHHVLGCVLLGVALVTAAGCMLALRNMSGVPATAPPLMQVRVAAEDSPPLDRQEAEAPPPTCTPPKAALVAERAAAISGALKARGLTSLAKMVDARITDEDLVKLGVRSAVARTHILEAVQKKRATAVAAVEPKPAPICRPRLSTVQTNNRVRSAVARSHILEAVQKKRATAVAAVEPKPAPIRRPRRSTAQINNRTRCSAFAAVLPKGAGSLAHSAPLPSPDSTTKITVAPECAEAHWRRIKENGTREEQALLGAGFEASVCKDSGRTFYYHIATGTSAWQLPANVSLRARMARTGVARSRVSTGHLAELCAASSHLASRECAASA
jgi:hypothetical protein